VNPFYFARKGLWDEISILAPRMTGAVLDIGCGSKPYQRLFSSAANYTGLEIDTPRNREAGYADRFYDGKHLPFEDGSHDSVFISQVLEHIFEPDEFLAEIHRVLKPAGQLLVTAPFVWDEHEQPHDYARYSSFGLTHLLTKHGFTVVEVRKSTPTIAVVFQLTNGYLYKKTNTKNLYLNLGITLVLMAPWNILGLLFAAILPRNQDLYLDNIILAQKV